MKMIYENWSAEIFPGFYDSYFTDFSSMDFEVKERNKYYFDIKASAQSDYKLAVAELWADEMAVSLSDNPIGLKIIGVDSVWSPKEYNFYTDEINLEVKFDLRALKSFCFEQEAEKFREYLADNWTSRDGFWSFVPDNLRDFRTQYKADGDKNTLIQIMLEFYLLQKVDFEMVEAAVYEKFFEVAEKYLCLVDGDYTEHDYTYTDEGYIAA